MQLYLLLFVWDWLRPDALMVAAAFLEGQYQFAGSAGLVFPPVDNFPPCKASFSTSFLFASRARGNRSLKCFHSSETLCQITAQTPMRISASWTTPAMYVHSSQPSCPLLLCFSCQTGYLHTVSSVSLCLPVIASVMMTNARTGLLASLYLVSSCYRCD